MARATMADLIARLRRLINDPAGEAERFTDDQIEAALDAQRTDVQYEDLEAVPNFTPGSSKFSDYYSGLRWWENDVLLQDGAWETLAPTAGEPLLGHWRFAAGQNPPVYASGKVYDPYAAGADLLDEWATSLSLEFDFSADGQAFQRAQKRKALLDQADRLRAQARAVTVAATRGDCNP